MTRVSAPAIAFDVTPLQNAHRHRGIGTYVRGLAKRLASQQDVALEFWALPGPLNFDASPPHLIVRLPAIPRPEYRGAWIAARLAMKMQALRRQARAVHITDPDALTRLRGRWLMTTVYDLIPLRLGIPRRRLIGWAGYRTYIRALKHVDVYLAISQQTAADLVHLLDVSLDRIAVAPPGIDLVSSTEPGVKSGRPYFLYLGGPNPNKNLSVLLDAMARCGELPEELLVAGHWLPSQLGRLEGQLEDLGLRGRARAVGFVPETRLVSMMRDATALVMPSRLEGFGLPVGEGLAAGAVVIHSKIPVLEETSRGAALTFDPSSPEDLADCLRKASRDPASMKDLRRLALERSRELTWDGAVATTLAAYRDVLAR
jgi:glycosyltransferase involved in cell wall biosynthesis